ncbi:class II aaRS and biotin synthetase [Macroventuria anomochaeta]|uniref:Class II aaRS and biotin synthetase n=1 Tax=Macroventuria anomochaeta TaxID=301207 RepID=A0ACB6RM03_9PLEO|nr:class II aaRS and biotin synthetase [Macroventuria anomochaeta]KAF2622946.1 class II aaRS and biotin synthetase [Macroventuria anomochaeta]
MSRPSLHFLRPYLYRGTQSLKLQHTQAYLSVQRRFKQTAADAFTGPHDVEKQKRLDQLKNVQPLGEYHPQLVYPAGAEALSLREFNARFADIKETKAENVSVFGRVRSVRLAGSKLMFLDIERDTQRLQIMVERKKLNQDNSEEIFKGLKKVARIGDWVSVEGNPTRTSSGQLSVLALKVPQILAPCLHHIPDKVDNAETLARRPHIHSLTSDEPADTLRLRALIYDYIRTSFIQTGFLEVETPMFDVNAGGAIARPFETIANEMSNQPLRLRIAPELNLKRLIVGGQDKIFEIGRAFRNEGVDNTHNPEFSTCEFYEVGATLPQLVERTEHLVHGLHSAIESLRATYFPTLAAPSDIDFSAPFAQLAFIPTIERASGRTLPNLTSPTATSNVLALFNELALDIPPNPTLPRLLDTLAEIYIEPLCHNPTLITHHPEALSPLSKSFVCPITSQRVAARVELFIAGREYVNAYEEENSPFEQRRKFMQQQEYHAKDTEGEGVNIDESYLEALEWGMPPTGGWGCGLDRLVMLFASKKRIADVLPFGTLRNVVSIAKTK